MVRLQEARDMAVPSMATIHIYFYQLPDPEKIYLSHRRYIPHSLTETKASQRREEEPQQPSQDRLNKKRKKEEKE